MSLNLARFKKPSRYMGGEVNIARKDPDIRVALCFPDTYEIGMSHLGLKILYSILNNIPYASAERVYAPWIDYEEYIRQNKFPLTSLESKIPLRDFDIVGFTLQYELSYTNILNMLDLGGMPVRAAQRGDDFPPVIAGGPCSVNPLPLAPFIDAFVIGDGEEVILEIVEEGRRQKAEGGSKQKLLESLSAIEGIYVPSIHDLSKKKIRRRFVADLNDAPYPDAPVVPYATVIHDRAAIEIARGCTSGCRFCQAGMIYRPRRERSPEKALSLALNSISNTGHEEVSFTSLSTGDYSGLLPLIRDFNAACAGRHVSVSLPSLRVGSITSGVIREIKSVRKTGFTIAPEAGTERLRNVINKNFTEEEYEETLTKLFTEGWKNIKLYFMTGLPTETLPDIDGLINMAVRASKRGREITGRSVTVNVGVSSFVPKSHTPFQWIGQSPLGELREKQDYLKRVFRRRGINFKGQHVEVSLLEAVFARGGGECALLLEEAWREGCRFDGWSEMFSFDKWLYAAEKTGIDLYGSAMRSWSPEDDLPWDFIDTGVAKSFLADEYDRALQQKITVDCRNVCHGCGLGCKDSNRQSAVSSQEQNKSGSTGHRAQSTEIPPLEKGDRGGFSDKRTTLPPPSWKISVPTKIRVKFSKTGAARYLSHSELMTAMLRSMRRAGIPVAYSAGFHPHPKISFGPALAAGLEGLSEYFDIELTHLVDGADFLDRLGRALPEGLCCLNAVLIPRELRALSDFISRYEYEVVVDKEAEEQIKTFLEKESCIVSRVDEKAGQGKAVPAKSVDVREMVEKAEIKDGILRLVVFDTDKAKVRPYEILREMLQKPIEAIQTAMIKRVRLYGYNSNGWIEPITS